jgi:hypothetical protein
MGAIVQASHRDSAGSICAGHNGIEAGFLRVLRFPLPILISPAVPCSSMIQGWDNRPDMPSGISLSPLHELKNWAREYVIRMKVEGDTRKVRHCWEI